MINHGKWFSNQFPIFKRGIAALGKKLSRIDGPFLDGIKNGKIGHRPLFDERWWQV
jgi:hypothetical protein